MQMIQKFHQVIYVKLAYLTDELELLAHKLKHKLLRPTCFFGLILLTKLLQCEVKIGEKEKGFKRYNLHFHSHRSIRMCI